MQGSRDDVKAGVDPYLGDRFSPRSAEQRGLAGNLLERRAMQEVLLIIHLLLAIAIVVVVLLQRSEGGALGIGGGGGGGGGFMTGRSAANLLTRATAVLAACFMTTSVVLTILASNRSGPQSILDRPASEAPANQPVVPAGPSVPRAE